MYHLNNLIAYDENICLKSFDVFSVWMYNKMPDGITFTVFLFLSACPSTMSSKTIIEWNGRCVYMSGSNDKVLTTEKVNQCQTLFGSSATSLMLLTEADYLAFEQYRLVF